MKALVIIFASAVLSVLGCVAVELSPSARDAFEIVKKSDTFCDEHVGYSGATPREVTALRKLVKEKEANRIFTELLEDASTPGKLYALCGLYFCDYVEFQRRLKPFRVSKLKVKTLMGCIGSEELVKDLVQVNEAGVVRLTGPKDSLQDWISKHPAAKESGFRVDILGGGWPELLVRGRSSKRAAEPGGAANRSRPVQPAINQTPAAVGSRR